MHATEMKTKRHYTSPVTQRATVELEGGFCGSVVEDSKAGYATVTSSAQEYQVFEDTYTWGENGKQDGGTGTISWD